MMSRASSPQSVYLTIFRSFDLTLKIPPDDLQVACLFINNLAVYTFKPCIFNKIGAKTLHSNIALLILRHFFGSFLHFQVLGFGFQVPAKVRQYRPSQAHPLAAARRCGWSAESPPPPSSPRR